MNALELYLLIAPFVLLTVCLGGAYVFVKWIDREQRKRDRERGAP